MVLAYAEMLLSLSLCSGSFETFWPYVYCSFAFAFVAVRSVFKEQLDLTCFIFLVIYFTQNTLVHIVDLTIHQNFFETQNDEQLFLRMFSYKLWQVMLVGILSLVYSQSICPSIPLFS